MSLLDKATIITTPTAHSNGTLHSIKGGSVADFDVVRGSSATRVNAEGLIEDVATNIPRIDYTDSTASILLEPQSTNLITYSEDFSNAGWNQIGTSTLGANAGTSPSGSVDAYSLIPETLNERHVIRRSFTAASLSVTGSFFAKPNGYNHISVSMIYSANSAGAGVVIDLTDGSTYASKIQVGASFSVKVDDYADGWKRVSLSVTQSANALNRFAFGAFDGGAVVWNAGLICPIFAGNGTDGVLIYGAQVEELTYATSYIPTSGAIATRLVDSVTGAGDATTFNSIEGVLYAEINTLSQTGTFRQINLSNGTASSRIYISKRASNDNLEFRMENPLGGLIFAFAVDTTSDFVKVAFRYGVNNFAVFINGVNKNISPTGSVFPSGTLNDLQLSSSLNQNFFGKVKSVITFDTALTDEELECLTTI